MTVKNNDLKVLSEMYNKVSDRKQLNELIDPITGGAIATAYGANLASKAADATAKGIGNVVGNIGARLTAGSQGLTGDQAVKLRQINKEFENLQQQLNVLAKAGVDVGYVQGKIEQYKANAASAVVPKQ